MRETVERVYYNVPYYRNKLQERGLGPDNIKSIDDISKLPFTTKNDLRDTYPFGMFAVPMSEIVEFMLPQGQQANRLLSDIHSDVSTWSEVMARTLTSAGAGRNDFIQIAYGYGLFRRPGASLRW